MAIEIMRFPMKNDDLNHSHIGHDQRPTTSIFLWFSNEFPMIFHGYSHIPPGYVPEELPEMPMMPDELIPCQELPSGTAWVETS